MKFYSNPSPFWIKNKEKERKSFYGIGNPVGGVTKLVIPKVAGESIQSARGPIVPVATANAVLDASKVTGCVVL